MLWNEKEAFRSCQVQTKWLSVSAMDFLAETVSVRFVSAKDARIQRDLGGGG